MPRERRAQAHRQQSAPAVAHIHWTLPPVAGGVETHLADVSRLLAARGHRVVFFTGKGALERYPLESTEHSDLLDLDTYAGRSMEPDEQQELAEELADVLRERLTRLDIGIVHGHNLHHFSPVPALALQRLEKELGLLVFHTYHSLWDDQLDIAEQCRDWPGQHAVSEYLSRECASLLPIRPSAVYLGVAEDRFRHIEPLNAESPDERVILLPARLSPEKGADTAVKLLRRVRAEGFAVRLVLTAPDEIVDWDHASAPFKRELGRLISEYGLDDYVEFVSVTIDEMPKLYARADIVIYLSTYPEPLGLAPLEAAAAARPVVVTRTGGLPETVLEGETGFVVPPGDLDTLTDRVRFLLTHPVRARDMGIRGRSRVRRKFALDTYVDRMVELYRGIEV